MPKYLTVHETGRNLNRRNSSTIWDILIECRVHIDIDKMRVVHLSDFRFSMIFTNTWQQLSAIYMFELYKSGTEHIYKDRILN